MPSPQGASGSQQSILNIDSITAHDLENLKAPSYSNRDKLDGSKNYVAWAFKMERQFQKDIVWFELICPDPVKPIPLTAEVRAEKLEKALYLFSISVRDHIIPVVKKHIDDPKELWQNLKIRYESAAMGKQLILREKLTLVRMSESLVLRHISGRLTILSCSLVTSMPQ
ncbi:unnamed protein product [Calypogeia fissa]